MAGHLVLLAIARYTQPMTRVFDMDDKARLPWRFYGASQALIAAL